MHLMLEHATWFLFAWVYCNQAGMRLPVVPALLGVGALATGGHLSMVAIMAIAVGASLAADLTWYGLGRWRGERGLKILGRIAPHTGVLVRRARQVFAAHVEKFQFSARFLPELNALAGGLAGATKTSFTRFVGFGAASALAWAGLWVGLGYLLSHALTETAALLGIREIVFFVAAFAFYLPFQRARRHRVLQAFRPVSIGLPVSIRLDDVEGRLQRGERLTIHDARVTEGRGVRRPPTRVHVHAD
jgi:membrane protein DedA with SNARE-associated domain